MSTCIDTANRDENYTGHEPEPVVEYMATTISKCLYCVHMPYGDNQECSMEIQDVIYCMTNNHCYFKRNNDVAIYVSNVQVEEFVKEEDFEV
jgi:hypothetical protein